MLYAANVYVRFCEMLYAANMYVRGVKCCMQPMCM